MKDAVGFLGLNFESDNLAKISFRLTNGKPVIGTAYHLVNAYSLVMASESPKLFSVLHDDVLLCDGKPLVRLLQRRESSMQQIRGADLMRQVLSQNTSNARHYFLGSTNNVLEQLIVFAKRRSPSIELAGYHAPAFTEDFSSDLPSWIKMIAESEATVVWIGLGTPKQDLVAHELAKSLNVHVVAVGAAFDFLSGNRREAPKALQKVGLEWFFRFLSEPRRLGHRYIVGNIKFLRLVLINRWFKAS